MIIKSNEAYLSLPKFEVDLPDFAILIGVNGSGKSQFINMLYTGYTGSNSGMYINPSKLELEHNEYSTDEVAIIVNNNWQLHEFSQIGLNEIQDDDGFLGDTYRNFDKYITNAQEFQGGNLKTSRAFADLKKNLDENKLQLNQDNFIKYFNQRRITSALTQLTNLNIGKRFYNYHIEYLESKLNNCEEEFINENGEAPWLIINRIFKEIGLEFSVTGPEDLGLRGKFRAKLLNHKNQEVTFSNLSSGERVLVSMVLWLFNSEDFNIFPKVILLDEPDAHLHPAMVVKLLNVLYDVLHKKFQVKIVLTTHNPTTVALANESCLYQVNNKKIGKEFITPINKDKALELLTVFVPNLSIDYKNHKQVFCESPTDVKYYQTMHNKYIAENPTSHKYYFISNSAGKSNCSEVYKIVEQIRAFGNSTSFGIVDFDDNNTVKDATKVHGIAERWAVENFILDPFYIIGLLYDLKKYKEVEIFGLGEYYNQFNIGNETNEKLQEIADKYFELFENNYKGLRTQKEKIEVEYYNDRKVNFPKWFLMEKSHGLEPKIKEVFKSLGSRYPNPTGAELQLATIDVLAKCYPFVPKTTVEFLRTLGD